MSEDNYIQNIKIRLQEKFDFSEKYQGLLDVYALLVLTRGTDCTLEDVHDAWSVWCNGVEPTHRSLIPFDSLTLEVQMLDEKYRDAIREVASMI